MTPSAAGATALWLLVLVAVAVTPLIVSPKAIDAFRLPKAVFFDAVMLLVLGGGAAWLLLCGAEVRERIARHWFPIAVAATAVVWTAAACLLAVQPEVARYAVLTALSFAVLFVATILFARGTVIPLAVMFAPAIANAVFATLQALHVWSPITLERVPRGRYYAMGLLGNPDYIGTFLLFPIVAAIAGAVAFARLRLVFSAIAVVLLTGLFFAQSVTATGTIALVLLSFVVVVRSAKLRIIVVVAVVAMAIGVLAYEPTRDRTVQLVTHYRQGQFNDFFSARLPAYVAAWDMFRERPLTGVGPGGFEAKYMSYKLKVDEQFPQWMRYGNQNFGETHNDYLQLLAETGIPGFVLFVVALAYLGSISFRRAPAVSERAEYARLFAFPAALGFATVALAQFPLYLTSTLAVSLFASALAMRWRFDENP